MTNTDIVLFAIEANTGLTTKIFAGKWKLVLDCASIEHMASKLGTEEGLVRLTLFDQRIPGGNDH